MNKNKSGEYRGKGGWSVRKQMCYNLKKIVKGRQNYTKARV